jgi:hypothetical protein
MTQALSESLALALPYHSGDRHLTSRAIEELRQGRRECEIRIGVGPLCGEIPVRVFGYASCIRQALEEPAARQLLGRACRVHLFSSAAKADVQSPRVNGAAAVGLGVALRAVGIQLPIRIAFASPVREVPRWLLPDVDPELQAWFDAAARRHGGAPHYAAEHAANSMFGDLASGERHPPLRATLGGETEAPFWALRMAIRAAAIDAGLNLAPALGLILRGVAVPWYYPTAAEPRVATPVERWADELDRAANPRHGGNVGLKKEAKLLRRLTSNETIRIAADMLSGRAPIARLAEAFSLSLPCPPGESTLSRRPECAAR